MFSTFNAINAHKGNGALANAVFQRSYFTLPGKNRCAGRRQGTVECHRHQTFAHCGAVFHARGEFLTDVAALFEIDPVEFLKIGFEQKHFILSRIQRHMRQPCRQLAREVVFFFAAIFGLDGVARGKKAGRHAAGARICKDDRVLYRGGALIGRENLPLRAYILDFYFCPQAIHGEALYQIGSKSAVTIEQIVVAVLDHKEVEEDFALWCQQGGINRAIQRLSNGVGHQIIEKRLPLRPAHAHNAARGKLYVGLRVGHRARAFWQGNWLTDLSGQPVLDKSARHPAISDPMIKGFSDFVGAAWDGSGNIGAATSKAALTLPGGIAPAHVMAGDEMVLAGFGPKDADSLKDFALVGQGAPEAMARAWSLTPSISSFGEGARGGFAAARLLRDEHRIWLARDQFGEQPLYYAEVSGGTLFSTSLPWLVHSAAVETGFDPECTAELLQLQFLAQAQSPYRTIRRVQPGETIVIERGRVIDRLRRPPVPLSDRRPVNREGALDALDAYFDRAVDRLSESDQRLACVLWGDLASTALAVAIARRSKTKTIALIPDWLDRTIVDDRAALAVRFAESLGFTPVTVSLTADRFWARLPQIVAASPDPVGDYAAVMLDALADQAKQHSVRLALPTGGQELFAAYGRYRSALRPLFLGGRVMRSRGHLQGLGVVPDGPAHWRDGLLSTENKLRGGGFSRVQRLQLLDLGTWLPNDVLLAENQLLVRKGVEVDRPYLGHAFAGFAFALSDHLKISPSKSGSLLHQWLERTFPTGFDYQRVSRGGLPLSSWIGPRASELGPWVDQVLTAAGVLPSGYAKAVFGAITTATNKRIGMAAWQLLYLATWYQIHVEGIAPDAVWINDEMPEALSA